MITHAIKSLFTRKRHIHKWQIYLYGGIMFTVGIFFTILLLSGQIKIPQIFATATSSITKDTDAHFSQGTLSSTQVVGSGSGAYMDLTGGNNWWSGNYSYRKQITVDITGNSSIPSGYTVYAQLSGSDASSIYNASLSSGNDFRVVYWDGASNAEVTRDLLTFTTDSVSFYFKTQASLSSNDTTHYFVYYGYASATAPTVDKTQVYNNTYNAALSTNGGTASASDSYGQNPIAQVNNGVTGGGAGSYGWGNNSAAGSRVMIKFTSAQKIWKIIQRWDGDNTGGWNKPSGQYFPPSYKVQISTDASAIASDLAADSKWTSLTDSSNVLTAQRIVASGSPTYPGEISVSGDTVTTNSVSCTNCWGTQFVNTFTPINTLSTRYVYGNTTWIGTLEEVYVYPINSSPATVEPTLSVGSSQTNLAASGTWESAVDSNVIDLVWNGGWGDGTDGSTAFSATVANAGTNNTISFAMRVATTANGLASASYVSLGTANSGTTFTKTKANLDALGLGTGTSRYVQVKATFAQTSETNPQLDVFTIY